MKLFLLPGLEANRNAIRLGSLLLKVLLFLPVPVFCQGRPVASATIPFAFSANGKTLPAGDYMLYRDCEDIFSLRTRGGVTVRRMVVYSDSAAHTTDASKLVFRAYANSYSLESFWSSGSPTGFRVLKSRSADPEIAAQKNAAGPVLMASTTVSLRGN